MWGRIIGSLLGSLLGGVPGMFIGHLLGGASEEVLKQFLPNLPEMLVSAVGLTTGEVSGEQLKKIGEKIAGLSASERQQIGDELQMAFQRAFSEALYDLGGEECFPEKWKKPKREVPPGVAYPLTSQGNQLWRKKDPLAGQVCWCLDAIVNAVKAQQLLPLEPPADKPGAMVSSYLKAETPQALNDAFFTQVIDPYLVEYKLLLNEVPSFERHLRAHLLDRTLVRLGEQLKQRTEVWRTFLRLLLEGLRTDVRQLGIGQQEMLERLDGLLDKFQQNIALTDFSTHVAVLIAAIGAVEKDQDERFDELMTRILAQHTEMRVYRQKLFADLTFIKDGQQELQKQVESVVAKLSKKPFDSIMLKQRQVVYLEEHELFAGRKKELDCIQHFLKTHSQGYIFVTGPSGFGKTALLANLIKQEPEQYVWYFFNRLKAPRNRKEFLQQMCEQLLPHYPSLSQGETALPSQEKRLEALYAQMMQAPLKQTDQRLILVIDGVDEAEGEFNFYGHFPRTLPKGKFIIFSARQVEQRDPEQHDSKRDYPAKLGLPEDDLRYIRLSVLDRDGIAALLRKAGGKASVWADDGARLTQVERVSQGDPFYLHYLAEDIAKGKIILKHLKQQPEGLEQYLDSWWSQVVEDIDDEEQLLNLVGILMVVVGPLAREDLFRLYPSLERNFDKKKYKSVLRFVLVSRVVSRKKGEQDAYNLCHPRFRDYLAEKKLVGAVPVYQEQLLAHCRRHVRDSLYALQFFSTHLLAAGQSEADEMKAIQFFRELLTLVDEPFLKAKIEHFRSYTSVLVDLKNAMHAATTLKDPVKLLGLALVYNGLLGKVVQLADSGVIPLYARFGEPELAQELSGMIGDETERAKAQIAVARELVSSKQDLSREMVGQVLANWRRYSKDYRDLHLGQILSQVLSFLPNELVAFLVQQDDPELVHSLVYYSFDLFAGTGYNLYEYGNHTHFDHITSLDTEMREKFKTLLAKALNSNEHADNRPALRLLLACLELNPDKAAKFASGEAAQIIVQVQKDRLQQPDGRLAERTVDWAIRFFLEDRGQHGFGERQALLHLVIEPHVEQFLSAISRIETATLFQKGVAEALQNYVEPLWVSDDQIQRNAHMAEVGHMGGQQMTLRKAKLLIDIGELLVSQHESEGAKKLLQEALLVVKEVSHLSQDVGSERFYDLFSRPVFGSFAQFVTRLSEELAAKNVQITIAFLKQSEILQIFSSYVSLFERSRLVEALVRGAARANIDEAIAHADDVIELARHLWRWDVETDSVWAILAEELARVDLERALTIWRGLNSEKVNRTQTLIKMLNNVPQAMYQRARDILIQDFAQKPPYQLYKMPVLLDIALRLKQDRPEKAQALAQKVLRDLDEHDRLEETPVLIGRLLMSLQQRFDREKWPEWRRAFFLIHIIPKVAECDLVNLATELLLTIKEDYGLRIVGAADLLQSLAKRQDEQTLQVKYFLDFLFPRKSVAPKGRVSIDPGKEVITDFAERLRTADDTPLISHYLLHQAYQRTPDFSWDTDYVYAMLAVKLFPFYNTDALEFLDLIQNAEVMRLARIDLYNVLPLEGAVQDEDLGQGIHQAIALVRIAAHETDPQKGTEKIKSAFIVAEKSFKDLQDEFTFDLLLQFLREVSKRDPGDTQQFARNLIKEVLATPRQWREDWIAERLFELSECGYNFMASECVAIERQSDRWVNNWEQLEDRQSIHEYLAQLLAHMARSTRKVNITRSLELIERATYHASLITQQSARRPRQQRILRFLLANEDMSTWEKAIWLSLDFGDAIFETFSLFGSTLLTMNQRDKDMPLRLKEAIEWAERLWLI